MKNGGEGFRGPRQSEGKSGLKYNLRGIDNTKKLLRGQFL
jgi:hypothetical protein